MTAMFTCNHCRAEDSVRQIKAGCGHVVHICDECEGEVNHIQHSECRGCVVSKFGGKAPEQVLREEATLADDYNGSPFDPRDFDDDFFIDDMDTPAYPLSCDITDAQDAMDSMYDPMLDFHDLYDY